MTDSGATPEANRAPEVIVVGNLTIDDVVRPDGAAAMGSLGGNVIYAATAARIWDVSVGVVSRVGEDFPKAAFGRLRDAGVDTLGVRPISGPTVRAWVLYEDDGRRSWVYRTPPERSLEVAPRPEDLPASWVGQTRTCVVHVAAMPLAAAARVVEHVRASIPGAKLTLDTHEDWSSDREALLAVARRVDVFLPSREQLQSMLGYDDPARACAELISRGVPAVVAKCGPSGALVATGSGPQVSIPAPDVVVVDATGAGDSFCGGFAAGLALGDDVLGAAQRGAATAGAALCGSGSLRLLDGRAAQARAMLASYQGREPQADDAVASADDYDIKVMRREISTIPAIIRGVVESSPPDRAKLVSELGGSASRSVVFVGCGDSAFVGQAAVLAFHRQAGRAARAEHALDFSRYAVRYQPEGTVVVAVSYSGKVGRTIEAAHQARAFGLPVVALTHDPASPLGRAADYVVQLDVPTLGFSPGTSTYIAMLTTLLTLAAELGAGDGASDRNSAYGQQLTMLSELARETLEMCDESSLVAARRLYGARMVTYLGAGPNEASARFGAAKLYEGAQQLACATNIEEWAHEQYFTTRPGDPVVLIAPSGAASDRAAEILSELAYVGATAVMISDQRPPGAGIYLPLPTVVEELSPVLAAIPLSLLGFHLVPLNNKRSYNFSSDEAKREHYDTIHRVTIGEPA